MPTEKKLTKEDTWKPAELTKHMRDAGHGDRRREERERRARDNNKEEERESRRARDNKDEERERRARDNNKEEERESRRARDNKDDERERRRSRDPREERQVERKREGAEEREKERRREGGAEREKEMRRERGEEREKERRRERGAEREKERRREGGEEREKERRREGGEEREKERRREGAEEREKERRREREADTRGPDRGPQRHREGERERHKDRAREREIGDEKEKRRDERGGDRRREGGREREGEEREKHKEREHRKEGDRRPDKERRVRRSEEEEEEKNKEPKRDGERRTKQEDEETGKEVERERRREKEERRREKEDGGGRDEERERRHRERRQRREDVAGGVFTERREPEETRTRHHGDQDAGEKERRRARRHPILPEAEAAGADVPPAALEAAAEPELAHGEPAYEDDFEEYEEDFEELDESGEEEEEEEEEEKKEVVESPRQKMGVERRKEVEAIQKAMEEENRRAGGRRSGTEEEIRPQESEQSRQGSPHHRGSPRGPKRGNFIDFVAAKQREINQKVASRQKKRSMELLRLVELDFSQTFSLLDLPPLSQYDVYIKSFGNTNTKQAYVQCREDDGERDVQTDLIEVLDKWSQHPADHTGACGDPRRSQDAPDGNTAQINIDSQRLATFLHSAVQVMSVLLEEDHAERQSLRTTSTQKDALSFSEGNLQLNTQLPFLHGRPCSLLLFSASQRQTLLSVHGPLDQPGAVRLDSWTLLCVWSMWEPSRPQKVLVYESEVRCCCFSPGRSALVLAGTSDGSLVLWDLREPAGSHHSMTVAGTEWTFRQPTFSTDAVLSTLGHHSAVNSIEVLPSSSSSSSSTTTTTTSSSSSSTGAEPQPPLLASEESAGMSFQLASLDERGILNLWVVLELTSASLAGSQTDLGLRPGGKVKLLHSSCMPAVEREGADLEALQLHFLPSDANHFLVTTNMGVVHHGTVHGFRSPPRDYGSQEGGSRPLSVTSLHFSPFNPQLFLVGCSDGSMRLHIVSSHWPLAEWTTCRGGGASEVGVASIRWSQSRPAVFCVLDSASHLHLWDLSRDALGPVATETLHADGVTAMAVFGSASSSSNQSSFSGVALAHRSGKLQLHYFNPSFSSANHAEDEGVLQSMMHQAL